VDKTKAGLLVLTRRLGEAVIIGTPPNAIKVVVVESDRGKVRLGFNAPKDVPIFREEIFHEREAAAAGSTDGT